MSPNRTTFSAWSLAAKLKKRERLILPIGSSSARRRAGAIGDKGSTPMPSERESRGQRSAISGPHSQQPVDFQPAQMGETVGVSVVAASQQQPQKQPRTRRVTEIEEIPLRRSS